MTNGDKFYLAGGLTGVQLWVHPGETKTVHITINDQRLALPNSDKGPGGFLTFNDLPTSANFNPEFLARCLEALRNEGVPGLASHEAIFMRPRHLGRNMEQRKRYIEEYDRFNEPTASIDASFDIPESRVTAFRQALDRLSEEFESDTIVWDEGNPRG